jgi:peptidoglycan/xylan/chitin deacetylase (PgdA/CDA1 family)
VLTIVMYHYVRDGARVHARTVAELDAQLDHVAREYEVVGCEEVVKGAWPANSCLLTFDDGLREHLETVAPALERRSLRGVFCVPARPVLERTVLDVQKSQFLLASTDDHAALGAEILADVDDPEGFYTRNTPPHRFDPPHTVFVKRALQDGLPEATRRSVLDRLFREHVTDDERSFAAELYLTEDECRELAARAHDVIAHGHDHRRLGLLAEGDQRTEIEASRRFVERVGGKWALCYPYGSRDSTTLRLLREAGCMLGLTTDPRRATTEDDLLELPRIDTNDLQLEIVERARVDGPVAETP